MEGRHCFDPPDCDTRDLVLPVHEYARGGEPFRCAIIGGYVYRGTRFPALAGTYVYADLCSGEIFGLEEIASGTWQNIRLHTSNFSPLTFGEDVNRELYLGADTGNVYQLVVE